VTIPHELYRHRRVLQREAEVVARFKHPVTDAPMVTWYQTCPAFKEEPEFYSLSEKEFKEAFELKD
jgi:hypothetical protein